MQGQWHTTGNCGSRRLSHIGPDWFIDTDTAFCFGTGKNEKFLQELNEEKKYFSQIIALEHPRFIMQYKSKSKQLYIDKYVRNFNRDPKTSEG